jgi:hypothetical protein
MADRIVLPLPDGRWLALDREVFDIALAAGAECMGRPAEIEPPAPKLLTAEHLEELTGVPASWFASQAREKRIPFRKFGRYCRFDYGELLSCEAFRRRAIAPGQMNCTGPNDRKGRASG